VDLVTELHRVRPQITVDENGVATIGPQAHPSAGLWSNAIATPPPVSTPSEIGHGAANTMEPPEPHLPSHPGRPVLPGGTQKVATDASSPNVKSNIQTRSNVPAWKRLIDGPLTSDERISLITKIFSDDGETKTVRNLSGDDAQAFVDVADQLLDSLGSQLRNKCLSTLSEICVRQALLPRSFQIPFSYFRSLVPIGGGGSSGVRMGEYQGRKVAVKVLRMFPGSNLGNITRKFYKEAMMWKVLHHPNVLPLLGVSKDGNLLVMVSEWMDNGNINQFIQTNRDADRFQLLMGATRGLMYIHSLGMAHGDLKGTSIVIDQNGHARLGDRGFLTLPSDMTDDLGSPVTGGTVRWMSPELLDPERFNFKECRPTKQSDCYALGMVILEVLSEKPPFAGDQDFIVIQKVMQGERPRRPEGAWFADDLWRTLKQCWSPRPEERPHVKAVLERLGQVSGVLQPPPILVGC